MLLPIQEMFIKTLKTIPTNCMKKGAIDSFVQSLPKAELHLHLEGTLEPEMMLDLARRNGIRIKYNSAGEIRKAYEFADLQEFLDIYYTGARVLLKEQDFFDVTRAYLQKASQQNVKHAELFFDPQTHTERGISLETVISGITRARQEARYETGITSHLIMSFLRHLPENSAMETLKNAMPYREYITGIGLDSSEKGHPPSGFRRVFDKARELGLMAFAHAGEEGPPEYVREAINLLQVARIDHGNRSAEDPELLKLLKNRRIPLTMCPLSNLRLKVVNNLRDHPLKKFLDMGIMVTVNSDDPAYFGGYIHENYVAVAEALQLSRDDIRQLAVNSFLSSVMDEQTRTHWITVIEDIHGEN